MPTFLWYYFAGLAGAVAVAMVLYFAVGGASTHLARSVFGEQRGPVLGRSFRLMLVVSCLIGGLSTQWYGCGGYTDYEAIAHDQRRMLEKSTEQVSGATSYGTKYLVGAGAIGALSIAVMAIRARRAA